MRKITLSFVWQGYEPLSFTSAFRKWDPFPKKEDQSALLKTGIEEEKSSDGMEESDMSDKDDDDDNQIAKIIPKEYKLDKADLLKFSIMVPEPCWIN